MSDKRTVEFYVLSASIASLAVALFYFTFQVTRLVNQIPVVVEGIEIVSEKIGPIVEQVEKVNDLITPILVEVAEVRKTIPSILEEVKNTREIIPSVLKEVKDTRETIPLVLKEVKGTREVVPSVLKEIKETRKTIPLILKEAKRYRKLVPPILSEVEKTREALPKLLIDADKIVTKAGKVSEGAATGVFKGIITAPFKIVGGLGNVIFNSKGSEKEDLTELDREIVNDKLNDILTQGKQGAVENWKNSESERRGTIKLLNIELDDTDECRVLNVKTWRFNKLESHSRITVCENEDYEWEISSRKDLLN